jgi:hypothetical protein
MKKHNGMRPLDIVVLLKIIAYGHSDWKTRDLAFDLGISLSEISESLHRSMVAGLLDASKKRVFRKNLMEFLQYGIRYVFPQELGALVVGIPTAHSAPVLADKIIAEDTYVWADANGTAKGSAIEPLYRTVPEACRRDARLYALLALVDVLRVGKTREIKLAIQELHTLFNAADVPSA